MQIQMNADAQTALKELLQNKKIEDKVIRIFMMGFGCSGPQFNIAVDNEKESDISADFDDLKIICDKKLVEEYDGFSVKYVDDGIQKGLYIEPGKKPISGCATCGGGCH